MALVEERRSRRKVPPSLLPSIFLFFSCLFLLSFNVFPERKTLLFLFPSPSLILFFFLHLHYVCISLNLSSKLFYYFVLFLAQTFFLLHISLNLFLNVYVFTLAFGFSHISGHHWKNTTSPFHAFLFEQYIKE